MCQAFDELSLAKWGICLWCWRVSYTYDITISYTQVIIDKYTYIRIYIDIHFINIHSLGPGGLRSGLPYLTRMIELKRRS